MKYVIIAILSLLLWNCKDQNQAESQEEKPVKTKNIVSKEGAVHPVAPELFSQFINVRDFTINTEGNEAYFTLLSPARELSVIMRIQKENNAWSEPKITSFSGQYIDLEPYLSPDGLQLYFASNRPVSKDSTHTKDFDIWYVERSQKDSKWSEPKHIKAPVNSTYDEFYPAITLSKNLYFTAIKEGMNGQDDIFMSRWNGNSYEEPIALSEGVNTKGAEFNAYVAPDESYILFSGWRRPDGIGSGDLYMSKREQGKWQTAVNLGATINSEHTDYCPFVNTVTGTLYFTSRRSYVEKKDAGYTNYNELLTEINRYDNGSSRIYKVDITDLISQ
ncbi:hypothetical protein [Psychroserpens sp. SPM9]|uniref:TolB family protein n=1 Tax=Psychroserpens sp. SPM9 TaxID=2975598 RepID=UPI0021A8C60A|nr:hypothetical protein [Psychroserpens sp. SPM9]MDG5490952.1 hypothetical protein [Psychroserpens sp. SPM9]